MIQSWAIKKGVPSRVANMETVDQAAIKVGDEVWTLPRPARHHTIIQAWCQAHYVWDEESKTGHDARIPEDHEQGFVTSTGRFVGRYQAARVARRANQIAAIPPTLTSEDLW